MAIFFACGAECASTTCGILAPAGTSHWDDFTGATPMSVTTTTPITGTRSFSFDITAGSGLAQENCRNFFTASGVLVVRGKLKLSRVASADSGLVVSYGTQDVYLIQRSTGHLAWFHSTGGTTANSTTALGVGTHEVEFRFDGSATTWLLDMRLNGVAQPQRSLVVGATQGSGTAKVGGGVGGLWVADIAGLWDDIAFGDASTDYAQGVGECYGYLADSDGTHSAFAATEAQKGTIAGTTWTTAGDITNVTTDAWATVDDRPGAPGTDGINILGADQNEYVAIRFANESVKTTAPRHAQLITVHRNVLGTAANKHSAQLHDGTSATTVFSDLSVGSQTNHIYGHDVTSILSSVAKLNAAELRYGSSFVTVADTAPEPLMLAAFIEVEFAPSVGGGTFQPAWARGSNAVLMPGRPT